MDEKRTDITPEVFKTGTPTNRASIKVKESRYKPKYQVEIEKTSSEQNNNKKLTRQASRRARNLVVRKARKSLKLKEEERLTTNDTEQFEKRVEDKLKHQNDMNLQRYEHLSSSLSAQITNAIDRLETSQNHSIDRLNDSQDNYFEKADLKTEKLLSDFREELRIERKKDRNTIVTWTLTGVGIIVTFAGILIPIFTNLLT